MALEIRIGRVRSVVLLVLFSVLTLNVYFFWWLYQVNAEFRAFLKEGVNPWGRLLLFILVPVIGWFLAVWLTARAARRVEVQAHTARPVTTLIPSLFGALIPILGWYVAAGYIQGAANRGWDGIRGHLSGQATPARLNCPDCSTGFEAYLNPVVTHAIECPNCHRSGMA